MAPSAVKVVGSYLLGTMVKPHLNVDISLSIPAVSCLFDSHCSSNGGLAQIVECSLSIIMGGTTRILQVVPSFFPVGVLASQRSLELSVFPQEGSLHRHSSRTPEEEKEAIGIKGCELLFKC